MLKAIETENVIKNIIREIIRECIAQGVKTNETLAAFVIRLLVTNPDHGFITDEQKLLEREDVERLVALCVEKLSEQDSPSLACIKMQVHFDTYYAPRDVLIQDNRAGIAVRVAPLLKEIVDTVTKNKDDLEKLYRKMIVAIILFSGLGNPTMHPVLREATVGLQSVFPPSELGQFMSLSRKEKEQQMRELTQIVTGIRLFNRDCQKGGEGIEDLPLVLEQALEATRDTLLMSLKKLMSRINILTTAVDVIVKESMVEVEEDDFNQEEKVKVGPTNDDLEFVKSTLVTARQLEVFIRNLLLEVNLSEQSVEMLVDRLKKRLLQTHDTVRFRTAIPTVQVYPQFIDLSEIWCSLQDEMVLLSIYNNILWALQTHSPIIDSLPSSLLKFMSKGAKVLTDEERFLITTPCKIEQGNNDMLCKVLLPKTTASFNKIPLQYIGFCVWVLVHGEGALIPGNPNMGILGWNGKYYAFSTEEAAMHFGKHPDGYVAKALSIARRKPELIGLLQMKDEVDAVKTKKEASRDVAPVVMRDGDVQTEIHPVPSYIEPGYTWNEWELKRRAIQLANISKCRTKSTQTLYSDFRRGVYIQAAPDKTKGCQTKKDAGTNVPTLQNYIYGLRGTREKVQRVITLTRPVHE